MRLDKCERIALEYALEVIKDDVYLFGSRVDEHKKGGDIDILIFSKANPLKTSQEIGLRFFKKCEEKIDILIMDPKNLTNEQQAFLNTIKKIKIK